MLAKLKKMKIAKPEKSTPPIYKLSQNRELMLALSKLSQQKRDNSLNLT